MPVLKQKWSIKYDKCEKCGTTEYQHRAKGLCQLCYERKQNIKYAAHVGRDRFGRSIASKKALSINKSLSEEILKHQYCVLGKSLADIARENNCTRQYILKLLKKYDIQPRTKSEARKLAVRRRKLSFEKEVNGKLETVFLGEWKINKGFFKSWTPEMAYVLGFIYADGNLFEGRNRNPNAKTSATDSRISIAQKDPEILEKIKVLMSCDKKLYKTKNTPKGYIYRLDLNGEEIFEDVVKLGLTPAKSLTVRFPEMPQDCVRHFIRGCWDGDGSVYIEWPKRVFASYVSGSQEFLESIVLELYRIGIRSKKLIRSRGEERWQFKPLTIHEYKGRQGYYIRVGDKNIEKLFHYFYDGVDESLYLKKKYDAFKKGGY
jgi:hypothetical protein